MYDSETVAALESGQMILRDFLTVHGKLSGTPTDFCFWTGEDDVVVNVVSAIDGSTISGNFIGGGTLLSVDSFAYVMGLEVRTISAVLSHIHTDVQAMVRAGDIRHAIVEIHRGLFDVSTGLIVSTPFPRWLGKVDGAPIQTPAEGGEGSITLACVSNTVELTRSNPARKSDETQRLRSGDRGRRYSDTAGQVELWWGEAKST